MPRKVLYVWNNSAKISFVETVFYEHDMENVVLALCSLRAEVCMNVFLIKLIKNIREPNGDFHHS